MAAYYSNVTVTAKTGPGLTVTSSVFNKATSMSFDFAKQVFTVGTEDGPREFDLATIVTVTYTISNKIGTISITT